MKFLFLNFYLISEESLRLKVKPEEYLDKLVEYCQMKIFAIATVEDTRETWADEDDFQVLTPNLSIKVSPLQLLVLWCKKPRCHIVAAHGPKI